MLQKSHLHARTFFSLYTCKKLCNLCNQAIFAIFWRSDAIYVVTQLVTQSLKLCNHCVTGAVFWRPDAIDIKWSPYHLRIIFESFPSKCVTFQKVLTCISSLNEKKNSSAFAKLNCFKFVSLLSSPA